MRKTRIAPTGVFVAQPAAPRKRSLIHGDGPPCDRDFALWDYASRIAATHCPVLLTGETGSGKGWLARWMHEHSPRADAPFIPVNCGAIPEALIDSHLFGHASRKDRVVVIAHFVRTEVDYFFKPNQIFKR